MKAELVEGKISSLIAKIAMPASIGFFFQTMYNVVDTYFAGQMSTEALAAMSISFPVFFIILSFANGISTGGSALISNALGAGEKEKARLFSTQVVSFGMIFAVFLMFFGLFLAPYLFKLLATSQASFDLALSYINIIFLGTFFFITTHSINSTLIASGNTKVYRNLLVLGFFLNLIFDPWFLYGGFGVPALGISGVALATVLIMAINTIYITITSYRMGFLHIKKLSDLRPRKEAYWEIIKQGFPSSVNMMTIALGIFVITYFLKFYGEEAVAAYGIMTRAEQIFLLPIMGLNIAVLAIVGQNNGAGNYQRMNEVRKTAIKYGSIIMLFSVLFIFFASYNLMSFFSDDQKVIEIGGIALKILSLSAWSYVFLALNMATLQAIKKPAYAFYISFLRQIVLPLPVYYVLVKVFDFPILAIWLGIFCIDWVTTVITIFYTNYHIKQLGE